ncbi:hypothetical protein ACFL36_06540 [Thermodesulfobacteriota bacterium]
MTFIDAEKDSFEKQLTVWTDYLKHPVSNSGLPDNYINDPGEIRQLTPADIYERRRTLKDPKSGREQEFIFIPQRLADRLIDIIDRGFNLLSYFAYLGIGQGKFFVIAIEFCPV